MKYWPVPECITDLLPEEGDTGSFWEHRGDRYHCGIDIYAPKGSEVLAVEEGIVVDIGIFTNSSMKHYWNPTSFVVIKTNRNIAYKYAELGETFVKIGQKVKAGEKIGTVGEVINSDEVTPSDPFYIREIVNVKLPSMLHLEVYKSPITEIRPYLGGNFLGNYKPDALIDPALVLKGVKKSRKNGVHKS